jgi:hypothetical protein
MPQSSMISRLVLASRSLGRRGLQPLQAPRNHPRSPQLRHTSISLRRQWDVVWGSSWETATHSISTADMWQSSTDGSGAFRRVNKIRKMPCTLTPFHCLLFPATSMGRLRMTRDLFPGRSFFYPVEHIFKRLFTYVGNSVNHTDAGLVYLSGCHADCLLLLLPQAVCAQIT